MNVFWVLNGQKIKRLLILTMAALFTAGIIYVEKDSMSVFSKMTVQNTDGPEAIYKVETNEKKLSLTFDISWGSERPGPILDVLEAKGVKKATFFLSAPWAEHHPEIVQRIKEMGFEIGSHGHKHINYSRLKDDEIREQILKADKTLKSLTGMDIKLLRTPNGDFDKRVLRISQELGYTVIQWDTDSKDWMNPGVDNIVQNVVSQAHPGDIILLHASDSSKQTHEALPKIIDQLKSNGYDFVTVSELISGVNSKVKQLN
ncbi:polysaccharide deacetylase family sporulation protein PdaB [Caldalkalibacillus mannanilyticus]|uniref:polysaccharide deacetylase family sporulation protein PdaB n=1 Tax=Caldalkalibacillus mannanilyticus TaxID=1418 RepID=UPI000468FA42|nr:polysaccharide deacetylase family sporulation protein PdaB [Caldalkalibacillus mannanilyticus]